MTAPDGIPARAVPQAPGTTGVSGAAVAVISSEGTVTGWSEAAERLLGYRAEDVVNRSVPSLPLFRDGAAAGRRWAERVLTRAPWSGTLELRRRDGQAAAVHIRAFPLSGGDGATTWLVVAPGPAADLSPGSPSSPVRSVLRALLHNSPVGLALWDDHLRCVWVNDTAERRSGILRNQRPGRQLEEALPGFDTAGIKAVLVQVLRSGVPVIDRECVWVSADGSTKRVFALSFFRVAGEDGVPLGVCSMSAEISDSWAGKRLAVLNDAGARVGTTLDVMTTAQELADIAVPLLADYVTVDLVESLRVGDEPLERIESTGFSIPAFRRAGVASIHQGAPESLWPRGEPVFVPPSSPFIVALSSRTSHFEPVLNTSAGWLDHDPRRARVIRNQGMHSLIIIPLQARGTILGIAVFVRTATAAPFSPDDLILAEELASRASLSLDNARRYTRERTAALALQRHLLPRNLTGGSAIEVASRSLPANPRDGVGGDWFDVIPLSGARVALVVGDVPGRGINAAATMGQLRIAVRTLANLDLAPDELLSRLDDLVVRLAEERAGTDGFAAMAVGATCLYVVYDPVTRLCTMARAGHPPPVIVSPAGAVTHLQLPPGAPLGRGTASFASVERELPEGSVIALYTHCLSERRAAGIGSGLTRLGAALSRTGVTLDELCHDVIDAVGAVAPAEQDPTAPSAPPADLSPHGGVALLLARTRQLGPEQVVSWTLASDPSVVSTARSLAVRQLSRWGLEHLDATLELIVSEFVTNAVRYGAGPVQLRLIRHTSLVCEVSDQDTSAPRLRHARATDENGRGLFLVAKLSHRWGARLTAEGKTAWAELELPARAPA